MVAKSGKKKKAKKAVNKTPKKKRAGRIKWHKLKHNGPMFPPRYKPLPKKVFFKYNRRRIKLSKNAEEVAAMYAKMLREKYVKKVTFNENFMKDWRQLMTPKERKLITDIEKCDFSEIQKHFEEEAEAKKSMPAEKKKADKRKRDIIAEKYSLCMVDGKKQKVGNFRVEPPGLFRGRGNHPKMGQLKKRITPGDVCLNLDWNATIPKPNVGGKWGEIVHNNTVTWLACWFDGLSNNYKYVFLNPSSKIREESDIEKYDLARALHKHIKSLRKDYLKGMKSDCPVYQQTSVALFLIDRLVLRVGNEKGRDTADTVGCCSLRKEHINLKKVGNKSILYLKFRGKDSMLYENKVEIKPAIFNAIQGLLKGKSQKAKLFDEISPNSINEHLDRIMNGLSAKVFRTYNSSKTLQAKLKSLTKKTMNEIDKVRAYEMANRDVALLCNHRRVPPKNYDKRTKRLTRKIEEKRKRLTKLEKELENVEDNRKEESKEKIKKKEVVKQKKIKKCKDQLQRFINQKEKHLLDKHIALSTSKLNYSDPRISVAWCKKYNVSIEEIYSKAQRERFDWAIQSTKTDFKF